VVSGNLVETLIGAVVLVVAGLFLVFAYSAANVRSTMGGYELSAKFDRVDGLNVGGDVRLSGIKVGSIVAQDLDPATYQARVRINVDGKVKLPDDSSAKIASEGLLGGNYLAIEPGGSETMLKHGGEIKFTQGSVNLLDLIGQAMFGAATGNKEKPAN
jgi:phospholipid/cholesterol/gamma-HCH transport system substrate-binding protein